MDLEAEQQIFPLPSTVRFLHEDFFGSFRCYGVVALSLMAQLAPPDRVLIQAASRQLDPHIAPCGKTGNTTR
jgi:hypothetical protein